MANEIAKFYATIGADSSGIDKALKGVKDDLSSSEKAFGSFQKAASVGLKAIGAIAVTAFAGFAAGVVSSVKAASDMEQGIADISAVMSLTAGETKQLDGLIKDLGLDPTLKVSATQAAEAIENLGTAGLSMNQIMGGAAESTVRLANATNDDFGTAASIVTDVMAQFNIEASELDHVVNQVAGTTVASKFDINDFGLAIAQAGGVAGAVGVNFEDFTATIAATSSSFASGSDAGTSFKTFLQRLVPTTADAKEALIQLGLSTGEDVVTAFFDASGAMRPMEEIAGNLQTAFKGLSESQKIEAASTIFGTDAMRTALALAEGGTPIIQEMKAAIGKVDAEEMGAKRMDTFAGALEIARGVIETLSISIGQQFLPMLRPLVEQFTTLAQTHGPKLIKFFEGMAAQVGANIQQFVEWAQQVIPPLWDKMTQIGTVIGTVTKAISNAIKPVTDAIGKFVGWKDILTAVGLILGGAVIAAITGFLVAMAPVILLVAKVTLLIAALRFAWENNFLGIRDITQDVLERIAGWIQTYTGLWRGSWGKTLEYFTKNSAQAWIDLHAGVTHWFSRVKQEALHIINTWIDVTARNFTEWVALVKSDIKMWAQWMQRYFREAKEWAIEQLEKWFGWFQPQEWVTKGKEIIDGLRRGAEQAWNTFTNWWGGIWRKLTGTVDVQMKIGSPSKVMEDKGLDTMKGFALGAQKGLPLAMAAMDGLSMGAIGAGSYAAASMPFAGGSGGASASEPTSTARIEELLTILIAELRGKNMSANVTVAGGGDSLAMIGISKDGMRI